VRRAVPPLFVLAAWTSWSSVAAAQPAGEMPPVVDADADGDGDIDDDDRLILEAARVQDVEVIEIEDKSAGQQLVESARAVTVIDTRRARERTADLGEVLSRAQGIQVRRSGGLGSAARFSLNGLYDDQIRFFLDGVPLEFAGWGFGVANVPVELVQRIEVHRGVVPVALGADALGGAIDLVTDPSWVDRAAASWQVGSFGMHRGAAIARSRDDDTGLAAGLSLFVDRAVNDYPIDVEVTDDRGRLEPATVRRFHDGYLASGGSAEVGVVERGALRRALVRVFATSHAKELQHNLVMTVPYGEAEYTESARGVTGDVLVEDGPWRLRVLGGAAWRRIGFRDMSETVYDWYGRAVRDRRQPGELGMDPTDQLVTETGLFARVSAERALGARQRLRLAVGPTAAMRGGRDFLDPNPGGRDPLSARRDLYQVVTGVEHEVRAGGDRIENIAFAKHYGMWADAEDVRTGFLFVPVEQRSQRFGAGDAARWRLRDWLIAKASYEWATRLPSVDEIFGDGILVQPNLELAPETSHNANLGARVDVEGRRGAVTADVNLFARLADRLIVLLGDDRFFTYQNVWSARIVGVEGSVGWVSPGEWASLETAWTVQDIRNASSEGTFAPYEGDRIPNRPWLLGSASGTVRKRGFVRAGDELSGFASSRYVHPFFRGWESIGQRELKQVIPRQLTHSVGVTYAMRGLTPLVTTFEIQNVTDARVFDSFGVQRPGRAFFVKISGDL
jgi:vitamin B12 transporter